MHQVRPALEGGAKSQVKHLPFLALDLDSTDPLSLACTRDETSIASKCPANASEAREQATLYHPGTAGAPSLEPTSSPAQVIKLGRSKEL